MILGKGCFGSLTRIYFKQAQGAFIVCDVTKDWIFEEAIKWKEDLESKVALPNGAPIPVVLLLNKVIAFLLTTQ